MSDAGYLEGVVEAALFAAGKPLSVSDLAQLFEEKSRPATPELRAALRTLATRFEGRAVELIESASGFSIRVRAQYAAEVARLWPERPQRYSRALLETLALIAYRQPITRAEIEAVRGVAVNPNIIKTLIDRNWVRVVGHRDVPGHPELLGTTKDFLDNFGLKSVEDLPPLAQIKAMAEINPQLELPGTQLEVAPASAVAALDDLPRDGDDPIERSNAALASGEAFDAGDALDDESGDEPEHHANGEAAPGLVAAGPDRDS